jgi:hypothetical protein
MAGSAVVAVTVLGILTTFCTNAEAFGFRLFQKHGAERCDNCDGPPSWEVGGSWHWVRSPDEEKRIVMGLFNRYCIRCHGVDGRGVWDIPGVPDLSNAAWQASRSDAQLARRIIEGRGAVMPSFRGALSLEEAWAMARYLRTFVPGTEISPPIIAPRKNAE